MWRIPAMFGIVVGAFVGCYEAGAHQSVIGACGVVGLTALFVLALVKDL